MQSRRNFIALGILLATTAPLVAQAPMETGFSYQGRLESGGQPADGLHDLQFRLFDAATGGNAVGPLVCIDGADVIDGLFSVTLDFGVAFTGQQRFLEIAVRADATPANCAAGAYTTLSPRQPLTATPYSAFALAAGALHAPSGGPTNAAFIDAFGSLVLGTGNNLQKLDSGGVARSVLLYDGSDNLQLLAPPDKSMTFRTGTGGFTSVRATLAANGRLGIGTAAPDVLVHILNGDVGATGTITASNLLLERTSDNFLTFMSPVNRASGLAFGRPGNTATELFHGAILYNEAALPDAMQFRTGGNVTRMTIDGNGEVGIGTTTPAAELHVLGGTPGGAAFQASDVLAVEGGGLPAVAIGMPAAGSGLFRFSKPSRSDAAKVQYNAATGQLFILSDGAVFLGTDSGSGFTSRMTVANDGDVGIGTNAPAARLHVVASPSGNASVILPNSAISAAEILDEPGVAGLVYSGDDVPIGAAFPDPPESVLSQSITTPAAGYVLAIATIGSRQVSTSAATVKWGLTTNSESIPADALMIVEFNPAGGAGLWSMPVTLHRLFPVSDGATTVHVMAQGVFGSTEFGKAQLSLVFIPTTYGSAPLTDGGDGPDSRPGIEDTSTAGADTSTNHSTLESIQLLEEIRAERAALSEDIQTLRALKAELSQVLVEGRKAAADSRGAAEE